MQRISVDSHGGQGLGASRAPSISRDGRFVAFSSVAPNLVDGDGNASSDVFVHDRLTGVTERVSVASGGGEAHGHSYNPSISGDGRFVAFVSEADDLVEGDTNGVADAFVHDRLLGTTERVSISTGGAQGNGRCTTVSVSGDGRLVAYDSLASNLVPGDGNGSSDVFVRDRAQGTTTCASVSGDGLPGDAGSGFPALAADGSAVAFRSAATTLVPDDYNLLEDVFVRDLRKGTTERVSVGRDGSEPDGPSGAPAISGDGLVVAFQSYASNLVDTPTDAPMNVFVHDRSRRRTWLASPGNSGSMAPAVSPDGRFVAFASYATNLVPGDGNRSSDIFVHDLAAGNLWRVSASDGGLEGNDDSHLPALSEGAAAVAFMSSADNLVAGDTNQAPDVFVAGTPRGGSAEDLQRVNISGDG